MSINWIDKNSNGLEPELLKAGQLIDKILSYSENGEGTTFNIIGTSQEIAMQLLRSFSILDDAFPNLKIRLGWMDNKMNGITNIIDGDTIIVGKDREMLGYSKVNNVKTITISSRASDNSKYLGFQRHFSTHNNPGSISLGEIKSDISQAETEFRSSSAVFFKIDAIQRSDSHSDHSPTAGLDIYESCSLMRLAGMSKALGLMYINIGDNNLLPKTSNVISIMMWYFLEGRTNQEIETMQQKENKVFLVSTNFFEEPIKFVVGHRTGRWWYQHPESKEYIPCADKDYHAISQGHLPDALMSVEV